MTKAIGRALLACLHFLGQVVRTFFLVGLMGIARALGGKPNIPPPEPPNRPTQVKRKE